MPVRQTTSGGKPGYQYGTTGKVYTYTPGDEASRERAKRRAQRQGVAIALREGRRPTL